MVGERVAIVLAKGELDCLVERIKPASFGTDASPSKGQSGEKRQEKI
jgi:hypothetical protein